MSRITLLLVLGSLAKLSLGIAREKAARVVAEEMGHWGMGALGHWGTHGGTAA